MPHTPNKCTSRYYEQLHIWDGYFAQTPPSVPLGSADRHGGHAHNRRGRETRRWWQSTTSLP